MTERRGATAEEGQQLWDVTFVGFLVVAILTPHTHDQRHRSEESEFLTTLVW